MNNAKRRRAVKAAARVPGNKPPTNHIGDNRATRRTRLVARPKPIRPLTDRERQYGRAAARKQRAELRASR